MGGEEPYTTKTERAWGGRRNANNFFFCVSKQNKSAQIYLVAKAWKLPRLDDEVAKMRRALELAPVVGASPSFSRSGYGATDQRKR